MSQIRQIWGRVFVYAVASAALAACDTVSGLNPFTSKPVEDMPTDTVVTDFSGAVVGDEPRAVVEARAALNIGGTAADGAVAMFFTLAATLPASASLGSGGVCLAYDARSGRVESLDFIARAPAAIPAGADRPSAVPGSPLGFWLLHARYGKLPWSQLVAPGERLARLGFPASRALIADFAPVAAPLLQDTESRRVFADPTGRPVTEGGTIAQPDLARVLATIRLNGGLEFYRGPLARDLVAGAKAAGGSLELSDLESYRAEWRGTIRHEIGRHLVHFPPPPAAAGAVGAQMLAMIDERGGFAGAGEADRLHILAETATRAYADRARWLREDFSASVAPQQLVSDQSIERLLANFDMGRHTPAASFSPIPTQRPENPSATTFAVVDGTGSAVSCALTMNNNFGTGRMARGTGVVLAALPNSQGRGPLSLGPAIAMNQNSKQLFFAGGASGGVVAPTALAGVMARVMVGEQPLGAAIRAPRIHNGAAPDVTYHEPEAARENVAQLAARGHSVATTPILGYVNAISCPGGMPRDRSSCSVHADPRGNGIGLAVGK